MGFFSQDAPSWIQLCVKPEFRGFEIDRFYIDARVIMERFTWGQSHRPCGQALHASSTKVHGHGPEGEKDFFFCSGYRCNDCKIMIFIHNDANLSDLKHTCLGREFL